METEITTMSQKGQVVIPQKVRTSLKLKPGTKLLVYAKQNVIVMKPFEPPEPSKAEMEIFEMFSKAASRIRK